MSDKYFITFRPATDVYAKAIKPYKKWRKKSDVSRKIDIDGHYYRVVRTIGFFNKLRMRRMLVCDDNGHVIDDEHITRQCFKLIMCLGYYQFNQAGICAESTHGKKEAHEPLIILFKDIWEQLDPVLDKAEQEIMSFHLHYLEEVYRLSAEIAEASKNVISSMEELQNVTDDTYPQDLVERYVEAASTNYKLKSEFEVVITEARERAGDKVSKILLSSKGFENLKDYKDKKFKITRDINAANAKAELFMDQAKKERKEDQKWSNEIKGPFSVETYLYELRYVYTLEKVVQMNVESAIHENWVFSPNCI